MGTHVFMLANVHKQRSTDVKFYFLLNTNIALCARHFTNMNSFNFDNDPMRQIPHHFTDEEIWLEMTLSQNTSTWFISNLLLVPKLIIKTFISIKATST